MESLLHPRWVYEILYIFSSTAIVINGLVGAPSSVSRGMED
jgi:hypothetical protein